MAECSFLVFLLSRFPPSSFFLLRAFSSALRRVSWPAVQSLRCLQPVFNLITSEMLLFLSHGLGKCSKCNWINTRMDNSGCGLSHTFEGLRAVANSLTGIENALLKCLFIFSWRWIHEGVWNFPKNKYLGDRDQTFVRLYLEKRRYIDADFISVFGFREITPDIFPVF
jgi:hypothetical protein